MRADAARNRARILEVALQVFREQGYDASLDLVAKRAGVGAGTLYRHFPDRESLVNALMERWAARIHDVAVAAVAAGGSPREVLLRWLTEYVGLITLHKGGAAKLTWALDHPECPTYPKAVGLRAASELVLASLATQDALRPTADATQLCRLVGGVAAVADQSDLDPTAVRAMLEVIADGVLQPAGDVVAAR